MRCRSILMMKPLFLHLIIAQPDMLKINFPLCLIFFLSLLPLVSKGQDLSNIKIGSKMIDTTVIKLDSSSIIPESFTLKGLEKDDYDIDFITATLFIKNSNSIGKVISYRYRIFSFDLSRRVSNRSTSIIVPKTAPERSYVQTIMPSSAILPDDPDLISTGSISRGFVLGNNQDLVLNSALNLQLSGMLAEDLEVSANITDRNIPIQPEGNTQMIQDFDRIFIRLNYKKQYFLNAGDLDITNPTGYFMVFNKRLLGMDFMTTHRLRDQNQMTNQVGGGVNKGKYIRQNLNIINGVQGPYKLTGGNNEINIVILSGSERVYLDGRLLTRGQENDYVIDYNTGELTFTSRILISSEKRIVVEYEYKSTYFTHYTLYTFNEFRHEKNSKLKLTLNFTHEQDLKNQSIQPELNNDQKIFLSQLGDRLNNAYYPNIDTAQYGGNEILYRKTDTVVNGIIYRDVYIYATDKNQQLYRLGFTMVGERKGNYILSQSTANGRVFQWVPPIDDIPQGNYEPVILLSTPKLTQLGTIGAEYLFSENLGINAELAFSNYDQNTFSRHDDYDNVGMAGKLSFFQKNKIKSRKERAHDWFFQSQLNYEYTHRNFYTAESYREIEFARNYNLTEDYSRKSDEHMLNAKVGFSHQERGNASYNLNYFTRPGNINALRNEILASLSLHGFSFGTNTSLLNTHDILYNTRFIKSNNRFSKTLRKIEVGLHDNLEYNVFSGKNSDSLMPNSYAFNEARIYIKNNDSLPHLYQFSVLNRLEYTAFLHHLTLNSINNEVQASFELAKLKNNRIKGNATFRNTQVKDTAGKFRSENFFVGSVEYSGRFFKNALVLTTFYEAGSGMEQKKVFSYLKVADGQGNYIWNDYNGNGIEELDEFEITAFQDEANYIKIWLNTADYILTYNNQFTQTIQLRPGNVWASKTGFLKFLSRFSNSTSFSAYQKNTVQNTLVALNPFQFNIEDSLLVKSTINFINNLSFNQLSPYWGIDFVIQQNQNKNLLYYGFESSTLALQEIILRGNPHKTVTLLVNYKHSNKKNDSQYLDNKNYNLESNILDNSVNIRFKDNLLGTVGYIYKHKINKGKTEKSIHHQFMVNLNYRMAKKGNLNMNIQYINLNYNADPNSSLSYEMLEGLNKGDNALWSLGYQTNITDFLQVELLYNGRFSTGNKVIHTGNIQLRAHF